MNSQRTGSYTQAQNRVNLEITVLRALSLATNLAEDWIRSNWNDLKLRSIYRNGKRLRYNVFNKQLYALLTSARAMMAVWGTDFHVRRITIRFDRGGDIHLSTLYENLSDQVAPIYYSNKCHMRRLNDNYHDQGAILSYDFDHPAVDNASYTLEPGRFRVFIEGYPISKRCFNVIF